MNGILVLHKCRTALLLFPFYFPILGFVFQSEISLEIISLAFLCVTVIVNAIFSKDPAFLRKSDIIFITACFIYCINFFVRNGFLSMYVPIRLGCVYSGYMAGCILSKYPKTKLVKVCFWVLGGETLYYLLKYALNQPILYFPNNSILSIVFAAQIVYILPSFARIRKDWRSGIFLALALAFYILFKTSGRAGWIGIIMALMIYAQNINFSKYFRWIGGITAFLIISILFFVVKIDSSIGRLFIYKVLIKELPWTSWLSGTETFRAIYNPLQARYFEYNGMQYREMNLADNTYFLFNDPLQFVLQYGLIGLGIVIIIFWKIYSNYKKENARIKFSDDKYIGSLLSIVVFFVSSLFNYTFQNIAILPLFGILLSSTFQKCDKIISYKTPSIAFKRYDWIAFMKTSMAFFAICIMLCYSFIQYKMMQAKTLSKAGYRSSAVYVYTHLDSYFIKDERIFYPLARELFNIHEENKALKILNKASVFCYDSHIATLYGEIFMRKHQFSFAEDYFLQSVYINPKSFLMRYRLLNFYIDTNQKRKALLWGKSILELKPKINSQIVQNIKNSAKSKIRVL